MVAMDAWWKNDDRAVWDVTNRILMSFGRVVCREGYLGQHVASEASCLIKKVRVNVRERRDVKATVAFQIPCP